MSNREGGVVLFKLITSVFFFLYIKACHRYITLQEIVSTCDKKVIMFHLYTPKSCTSAMHHYVHVLLDGMNI